MEKKSFCIFFILIIHTLTKGISLRKLNCNLLISKFSQNLTNFLESANIANQIVFYFNY